jgi:hypothetical protein
MRKLGFVLLVSLLFFTTCKEDFLVRPSLTQPGGDQPFTSSNDVNLALNGVYSVLQSSSLYGGSLNGWQGYPGFDGLGDNAFNQFKWEGPGIFMEGNLNPSTGPVLAHWTGLYRGISRANLVISKLRQVGEDSDLTQDQINESLGQALFLRSLFYFNLSVYFEDAPLILEPQTVAEAKVPKNSYEEVTAQIVEDLIFASENLPESYPSEQYGYATRGAALALFARVQLYNNRYDGENGVLELTNEILGLGYELHPNYGELFSEAGEESPEIVFSVRFQRELGFNNTETFSGTFQGTPKVDQRPMPNLVNSYYCIDGLPITESPLFDPDNEGANRDPRANATIYFEGDIYLEDLNREFRGNSPTSYGMRKYIRRNESDEEGIRSFQPASQDFYVIRYADVLLMRAEAMAETGDIGGATSLVNEVRARVGMPRVQDVEGNVGQAEMIDIVRHERRVELALEGLRFMDLKRWGEILEAFNRASSDPVGPYNPNYLGGRSEVFPIPQDELDVNTELVQHPDW